jgi:hypothetical protein
MNQVIEFPLEGTKDTVLVEVAEEDDGISKASRGPKGFAKASQSLEKSVESIRPMAELIIKKLRGLSEKPAEITVVFGLKLNGSAGAILASSSVEANYTVTLKWVKEEKKSKA